MNKAQRILDHLSREDAAAIGSELGTIDAQATPLKQARYIRDMLNAAERMRIDMTEPMRQCGGCCLSANAVKTARKLYAKSGSVAAFLELLNEADIGGRHLRLSGNSIIAVYKTCLCNIPKKVEHLSKSYCECSAGWYRRLFSEAFDKQVSVKIVDTIVNGAAECTFEISGF